MNLIKRYFEKGMSISLTASIMLTVMGFTTKDSSKEETLNIVCTKSPEVVEELFEVIKEYDKKRSSIYEPHSMIAQLPMPSMAQYSEEIELTNEEKLEIILEMYGITEKQFNEIVATVIGEAAPDSYEDAYAVINVLYNRLRSYKWHNSVDNLRGPDGGYNIYYQLIQTGQFEIYYNGAYKLYLNEDMYYTPGYQAVIDMLYSQVVMHNYLNFTSKNGKREGKEQFVDGGNLYYSSLKEEDIIDITGIYTYEVEEKNVSRTLKR